MNILRSILKGTATPAVPRPVPMVPSAASDFGRDFYAHVADLQKQVVMYQNKLAEKSVVLGPQTRRYIENLERQYKMEQLRTKELREQLLELEARLTVLQEAGNSDLVEDYEGLSPEDVIPWVERVLLPAYGRAAAKLKALSEPAQLAKADPVYDYEELAAAGVKPILGPKWEERWFFADEESEERFHRLRRGEILHGLIVIEGPPASGKTLMGELFAGRDSAQQLPSEIDLARMIAADGGNVLFFDNIDTRHPWYQGAALHSAGTKLHSAAVIEAIVDGDRQSVILAGQHIALSPEMQSLALCIRLKGGAA